MPDPKTRLVFKDVEVTNEGILIRQVEIIDMVSGEHIRPAKLTKELASFLEMIEIDTDLYFDTIKLCETNPALKTLIQTFSLNT